jgi:Tc5 transposase-like DNA-binding protein
VLNKFLDINFFFANKIIMTRNVILVSEKQNIIRDHAANSIQQLAEIYGYDISVISKIIKKKEKYLAMPQDCQNTRCYLKNCPELDNELVDWIIYYNNCGFTMPGTGIQYKAQLLFEEYINNKKAVAAGLKFSDGWLANFKKRKLLRRVKICGETALFARTVMKIISACVWTIF